MVTVPKAFQENLRVEGKARAVHSHGVETRPLSWATFSNKPITGSNLFLEMTVGDHKSDSTTLQPFESNKGIDLGEESQRSRATNLKKDAVKGTGS